MQRYGITALARRQLAEKLKIPHAYFERMRTEQPELLDRNVNAWLSKEEGDEVTVTTPNGSKRFEVVKLQTIHEESSKSEG